MVKRFLRNRFSINIEVISFIYALNILLFSQVYGSSLKKDIHLKVFKPNDSIFQNKNSIIEDIKNSNLYDNRISPNNNLKIKTNEEIFIDDKTYKDITDNFVNQYNSHYLSIYRSNLKGNYLESDEKKGKVKFTDADKCFCNFPDHLCDGEDYCIKAKGAACFHSITKDEDNDSNELYHEYGCAPLERGGHGSHFTCNAYRTLSHTKTTIACCYEGNKCNLDITPLDPKLNSTKVNESFLNMFYYNDGKNINYLYLGLCLIALVFFTIICFYLLLNILITHSKMKRLNEFRELTSNDVQKQINENFDNPPDIEPSNDFTSGSGSLLASLNQRTIALDIRIDKMISKGRYGEVHRATYRGSYVAVKTFYTTVEDSWNNEKEIYLTEMFNHENILQFIAADICSVDSITKMLLITDYHPLGSLYDYLQNQNNLSIREALSLAMTSASGLEHLHNKILGTGNNKKPEMAHRDIKSKNIIVKRHGVCCLADFGMAIKNDGDSYLNSIKIKVGTRRYMAPELLNETLNPKNFESFKQSDIYSFSLVLWEIVRRINDNPYIPNSILAKNCLKPNTKTHVHNGSGSVISGNSSHSSSGYGSTTSSFKTPLIPQNSCDTNQNGSDENIVEKINPYYLPFEPWVPSDPSFEHMHEIVCVKKMRPEFNGDWFNENNFILETLSNLIKECWFENPLSRHTALKIKKDLLKIIELYDNETLKSKPCHNINFPLLSQTSFDPLTHTNDMFSEKMMHSHESHEHPIVYNL
uniref:receptor protein serine/threonine kinase n=1 Tax=Parastrongyloides trichosuri TaxID=131310 RepID=A0A0N4Z9K5_PARTI